VIELLGITQFFDAGNFFAQYSVRSRSAKKVGLGEATVIAIGVFGLDDGCTDPRRRFAWM
jgi:hypothetical protein